MNPAWMRMAPWALDVILAVWLFLPLKARKNPEDIDICIIFGNLLDNAIEASRKLSDPARRSILVKSHIAAENMVITLGFPVSAGQ